MKISKMKVMLLTAIFMITVFAIVPVMSVSAKTVYVDVDVLVEDDGTTLLKAFDTIQEGIDDASSSGDIILVAAGTYVPSAMLNGMTAGSILRGNTTHPETVIISGSALSSTQTINANANDITIEGFTMLHAVTGVDGIWIRSNTAGVIIQNNIFTGNAFALQVEGGGATGAYIFNNTINSDMALQIWEGTQDFMILNNTLTDDYTTSNGDAITLWSGATGQRSSGNHFIGNTIDGKNNWGIILADSGGSDLYIDDTWISGNTISGTIGNGIRIQGDIDLDNLTITGNYITDSTVDGIEIEDIADASTDIAIYLNDITGSGVYSIDNLNDAITINATKNYWGGSGGGPTVGDDVYTDGLVAFPVWLSASISGTYTEVTQNPTLDETNYAIGDTVIITLYDNTENVRPLVLDTVDVVVSGSGGTTNLQDQITVTLTETGVTTGIYTGSLVLVSSSPGASDLLVENDTTVQVSYEHTTGSYTTDTAAVDGSAPVITIISPVEDANITDTTPLIVANLTDTGTIDVAWMELDGRIVDTTPDNDQLSYQVPSMPLELRLEDGVHTVEITASDISGNLATETWTFTIDNGIPNATVAKNFTSPVNATVVEFLFTWVEDMNSTYPTPTLGGNATTYMTEVTKGWLADVRTYSANYTVKDDPLFNGTVVLALTGATDMAGNAMTEANVTYYIDNMPPTIPTALNSTATATTVTLSWVASADIGSGMASYKIYKGGVLLATIASTVTTYTDSGLSASAELSYVVQAVDLAGNTKDSATEVVDFVLGDVTEWEIDLVEGWNLVSMPLIPDNSSIAAVLADVLVNVTKVWSYVESTGTWLSYVPGGPPSLTTMVDGEGYWIEMSGNSTLTVHGVAMPAPPALPPTYELVVGWNLIGFKGTDAVNATTYLGASVAADTIRIYGYAAGAYTGIALSDDLTPGMGYWIAMADTGVIYP